MTIDTLTVNADLETFSKIREFVEKAAKHSGISEQNIWEIRLAVDKACANIIQHDDPNKKSDIDIKSIDEHGRSYMRTH